MNNYELYFLKLIEEGKDISSLLSQGLTYSQIMMILQEHIRDGNVETEDYVVRLTELGKKRLDTEIKKKHINKRQWILPQAVIKKSSLYTIMLPKDV